MVVELAWLIPVFPALAFLLIISLGKKMPKQGAYLAIGAILASLTVSALSFLEVLTTGITLEKPFQDHFEWFAIPGLKDGFEVGIRIDPLSALMALSVSFVGSLIMIYSVGYMAHEEGLPRYYAEMSLFVTSMLGLVLANNLLLLFMFWELVGLCSYLLIGFWYKKPSAASAAKKAFVVTRVGDFLFLGGLIVTFYFFGTFNFLEIEEQVRGASYALSSLPALAAILIFGGAQGKSAQFPLHVWLPDAMEGPTTVSALIHAATMVKAGVYLVARSFPLFNAVPDVLLFVAIIGGFTAILAASMALVATDIKRIIAYSTMSQLGYMFLALGAVGLTAGMFHLASHSIFKALLFLCAGSVIHAVGFNDIGGMGGLRKGMKITSITMLIGALSLAGIPPFSGFFSKDEIIASTYNAAFLRPQFAPTYLLLFATSVIVAYMTAFYIFRLWFVVFTGKPRSEHLHSHEAPRVMTLPLTILALVTVGLGASLFLGQTLNIHNSFGYFLAGEEFTKELEHFTFLLGTPFSTPALSVVVAGLGIFTAYTLYYRSDKYGTVLKSGSFGRGMDTVLANRWYFDRAYNAFAERAVYGFSLTADWVDRNIVDGFVNGLAKLSHLTFKGLNWFDIHGVDGLVNAIATGMIGAGRRLRTIQTGIVSNYALAMAVGMVFLLLYLLLTIKV